MTTVTQDFIETAKAFPTEVRDWWKGAHHFPVANRYEYDYEYDGQGQATAQIRYKRDDYVLWKRLGRVEDVLYLVIVALIILAVLL